MNINEKEIMQELKDIKNIKMDVIPANVLYGNIFKAIGLWILYFLIIVFYPIIVFLGRGYTKIAVDQFPARIVVFIILGFAIGCIIFNISYYYTLFKEGIAPNLKAGRYLCNKFKKLIKITVLIHFIFMAPLSFLLFPIEIIVTEDSMKGVLLFFVFCLIITVIILLIADKIFKIELTRLGAPHLLEVLKDVLSRNTSSDDE